MNFLCICEMGQNRSVALTRILHDAGHAAIALGWRTADANAMAMLSQWAHHIVVVEDDFKWKVPSSFHDKVVSFNVGGDRWPSHIHPELHNILKSHYVAWVAGDKDPGHSATLRELAFSNSKHTPSDINEHLETLREYASQSRTVLELGTRADASTTALLAGQPERLVTAAWVHCDWRKLVAVRGRTDLVSIEADSRNQAASSHVNIDLMFVNAEHSFRQVAEELAAHASRVQRWIIIHKTVSFPPVLEAIRVFLAKTPKLWKMKSHAANNNGLLVIERIAPEPNPA